jgi:hypothetical protein
MLLSVAAAAKPPTVVSDSGRLEDCPDESTIEDFQAAAQAGERAFANIDLPALTRAREMALQTLPCLAPITPEVAADFHRMMAMAAFTAGDEPLVLAEFHAARRLDPGYVIPAEVVLPGHPLVRLYDKSVEAGGEERELEAVIPPLGGTVVVDGTPQGLRPNGLSAVLQVYQADGELTRTTHLLPGDPTPRYGPVPLELEQNKKRRRGLLVATGTTALIASGLYTRAVVGEQQFTDTATQLTEPRQEKAINNAYFWGGVGVGTVSLGLGVFTTFTW